MDSRFNIFRAAAGTFNKLHNETDNSEENDEPQHLHVEIKGTKNVIDESRPRKIDSSGLLVSLLCLLVCSCLLAFSLINSSSIFEYRDIPVENLEDSHEALSYKPEQIHLSLGADSSELYVTWSTMKHVDSAELIYSKSQCILCLGQTVQGSQEIWRSVELDQDWAKTTGQESRTYFTYRARMQNLEEGSEYMYAIKTSLGDKQFQSKIYSFQAKNLTNPDRKIKIALYGDLGLINGQSVPRLTRDVDEDRYDLIIHNGDFAYDLNTHNGRYGDEFMRMIEPIAARVAYQTSVGNHEIAQNFSHYDNRFTMINSGGIKEEVGKRNNHYYSFNIGPVHFVAFSTEFYYFLDSVGMSALRNQYEWLKKDLRHASSSAERLKRPWIVVFGHRPMYCSSRDGDDCSKDNNILRKGLPFFGTYALEKLFYDYGVDVEFYSHEHQYERFLPIYDGKVLNGTDKPLNPYHNPMAPVHLISGSAGCQERLDPFMGHPATGSVKQISDYGYTRLEASRCKLRFQQISDDAAGDLVDEVVITKTKQNFPIKSEETLYECPTEPSITDCLNDPDGSLCPGELFTPFN